MIKTALITGASGGIGLELVRIHVSKGKAGFGIVQLHFVTDSLLPLSFRTFVILFQTQSGR